MHVFASMIHAIVKETNQPCCLQRPLDAARIRKERRKVVALQADDEITSFRGTGLLPCTLIALAFWGQRCRFASALTLWATVCCACTCMVLQTGKLYEYLLDPTAESGRLGETPAAGAGGAIEEQARAAGVMRPGMHLSISPQRALCADAQR